MQFCSKLSQQPVVQVSVSQSLIFAMIFDLVSIVTTDELLTLSKSLVCP